MVSIKGLTLWPVQSKASVKVSVIIQLHLDPLKQPHPLPHTRDKELDFHY